MMHTDIYCLKLADLDRVKAVRAIHQAWLQLRAHDKIDHEPFDNEPALAALADCLKDAGHPGFQQP